jgi:hypothetical protein
VTSPDSMTRWRADQPDTDHRPAQRASGAGPHAGQCARPRLTQRASTTGALRSGFSSLPRLRPLPIVDFQRMARDAELNPTVEEWVPSKWKWPVASNDSSWIVTITH